ncbi:MAG: hypothetical protein QW727_04470 [Candidatus Pacearchaeota archaeon]
MSNKDLENLLRNVLKIILSSFELDELYNTIINLATIFGSKNNVEYRTKKMLCDIYKLLSKNKKLFTPPARTQPPQTKN